MTENETKTLEQQAEALAEATRYCLPEFRALCIERFILGHAQYGDAWAGRDNVAEALQEAADLANYAAMALLNGEQPMPVAQAAVMHAFYAWRTLFTGKLPAGEIGREIAKAQRKAARQALSPEEPTERAEEPTTRDYEALARAGELTPDDVRDLRRSWGLTQKHVADLLGLCAETISDYERGRIPLGVTAQRTYLRAILARKRGGGDGR